MSKEKGFRISKSYKKKDNKLLPKELVITLLLIGVGMFVGYIFGYLEAQPEHTTAFTNIHYPHKVTLFDFGGNEMEGICQEDICLIEPSVVCEVKQ